ncbi:MAG TPA: G-D-S-L family lipolytic protein [Cyanobacteria bacterium UBA8803]|nr:G-D-S-L family lipolytic protein [Cyanobacteria bacterium UBA9273]HBL62368.1 G-D-S-L family lipolytic protein [Cyanobacteria bacterium UBA8803]
MNTTNKALLLISLTCNLIFIAWFSFLIGKRGGLSYITEKISRRQNPVTELAALRPINTYQSSAYVMRKLQFEALPKSERAIVFLGDSLTAQGEWAEWLGNSQVKNRGISGDTTDGVLNRLEQILETQPAQILIMIGTNDIWNEGKSVGEVVNNYQRILDTIKKEAPKTQVFVQSLLPVNNQQYRIKVDNKDLVAVNRELQRLASQFSFKYIDLYQQFANNQNQLDPKYTLDGVHLNGQGYLTWKKVIENYIMDEG